MHVYVYAIARAETAPQQPLSGLFEQPTRRLAQGPLAAIVSTCPARTVRAERQHILASQRVLRQIGAQTDILPMAFGTVADSEAALAGFLAQFEEELRAQLQKVAGMVEMGLTLRLTGDPIAYLVSRTPELQLARVRTFGGRRPPTHDEKLRLGQLCDASFRSFRESLAAQILAAIGSCCKETRALSLRDESEIVNLALLIARDGQGQFERAVDVVASQLGDEFVFSIIGPAPPHNFVRLAQFA